MPALAGQVREPEARSGQVFADLLGGGLLVWGIVRGSWSGLALAAAGGLLLSRGLTSVRSEPIQAEPSAGHDLVLPEGPDEDLVAGAPALLAPPQAFGHPANEAPLTEAEQAVARTRAYRHALERGGGRLPPYDAERAVDDFRRAAGEVVQERAALQRFLAAIELDVDRALIDDGASLPDRTERPALSSPLSEGGARGEASCFANWSV
jgi:hypothetical protein